MPGIRGRSGLSFTRVVVLLCNWRSDGTTVSPFSLEGVGTDHMGRHLAGACTRGGIESIIVSVRPVIRRWSHPVRR